LLWRRASSHVDEAVDMARSGRYISWSYSDFVFLSALRVDHQSHAPELGHHALGQLDGRPQECPPEAAPAGGRFHRQASASSPERNAWRSSERRSARISTIIEEALQALCRLEAGGRASPQTSVLAAANHRSSPRHGCLTREIGDMHVHVC